jgi:hypothetical protein
MATSYPVFQPGTSVSGTFLSPDLNKVLTVGGDGSMSKEAPNASFYSDSFQLAANGDSVKSGYLSSTLVGTATTVAANATVGAALTNLGAVLDTYVAGLTAGQRQTDRVRATLNEFLAAVRGLP